MQKLCAVIFVTIASSCSNPNATPSDANYTQYNNKRESYSDLSDHQWEKIIEDPDSQFALSALSSMGKFGVFEELNTERLSEIVEVTPDSTGARIAMKLLLSQISAREALVLTTQCVNERLNSQVGVEAASWLLKHYVGTDDQEGLEDTLVKVARNFRSDHLIKDELFVNTIRSSFEAEGWPVLASQVNEVQDAPAGILPLLQDFLVLKQERHTSELGPAVRNLFRNDFYCYEDAFSASVQLINSLLNDIVSETSPGVDDHQSVSYLSLLLAGITERVRGQSCLINSHAIDFNQDLQYLAIVCAEAYQRLFIRSADRSAEEFQEVVAIADRLQGVRMFGVSEILYNFAFDSIHNTSEKENIALKLVRLYAENLDAKNYALKFLNENFEEIQSLELITILAELEYENRNFSRVVNLLNTYRKQHPGTAEQMNKLDFIIGVSMIRLGDEDAGRSILERLRDVTNSEALKQTIETVLAI